MKKLFILVLALMMLLPLISNARLGQNETGADLDLAIAHVRGLMNPVWNVDEHNLHQRELKKIAPSGAAYIDEVLAIMAARFTYCDTTCKIVLQHLGEVIRRTSHDEGVIPVALKESMRANANVFIMQISNEDPYKEIVSGIFDKYDLWSGAELPYLVRRLNNFMKPTPYQPKIAALVKAFPGGSEQYKNSVAVEIRTKHENLLAYAVLYKNGLLRDADLDWLIRLFMKDVEYGYASNVKDAGPLLDSVLTDLQQRLKDNDPAVVAAFSKVTKDPRFSVKTRGEETVAEMKKFLEDFRAGTLVNCEKEITPSAKPASQN